MASQNLGSLTLDLIANTGGFTGPLDQAARITKKQMKEMGMAVDEFGNYTDKAMKQAAQATKQLDTQFEKLAESLQRETALYGETSRAAQMRYDLEKGALQNLSAAQKDSLTEMTRRLSAMESANAAFREQAAEIAKVNGLYLQHEQAMKREIALYGETSREAKIRYEIEHGALVTATKDKQFKLLLDARALDAMDAEAAKARQLAAATKQLDATHDQLQETMLAELATYGQVTRVAKLRYDMERGALRGLTEAQKQSSIQLAQQLDNLDKAAQGSMRGIRGVATGFGYQIQDIAVQAQMGTNAMMIFAQQGSQIASLFGPAGAVAGAVIAVGGAIAGGLLPSLFDSAKAADELTEALGRLDNVAVAAEGGIVTLSDSIEKLAKSSEIAARAQIVAGLAEAEVAAKKAAASISEAMDEINAGFGLSNISDFTTPFKEFNQLSDGYLKTANELGKSFGLVGTEATDAGFRVMNMLRTLREAPTPENFNKLRDSVAELAVSGGTSNKEFLAVVASMNQYFDAATTAEEKTKFLKKALDDLNGALGAGDASKEFDEYIKKLNDWVKAQNDAAKKAREDEKSRADSIAKTIAGMEREIALYGVTSKAAQTEYDILNGVLKVKGGLEGVEGRRLVQLAKTQDAMDEQKASQDEYVAKLKEWVKGERDMETAKDKILQALKDEEAQLGMTADAYLEMQLRAKGATDEEVADALNRAQRIRERKAQIEEVASAEEDLARRTQEMWNRIDGAAADAWSNMMDGTKTSLDGIADMFKKTLAEMAHEAVTKPILVSFQNQISGMGSGNGGSISGYTGQAYQNWLAGKAPASSGSGGAASAIGMGGIYAAGAALAIAAVSSWNKSQDEKFEKMTAAYRQGVQSTGTLLGMANAKSDSIAQTLSEMGDLSGDVLNVNRDMYMALLAIESGINGVAAGFARQFGISGGAGDFSSVKTGTGAFVSDKYSAIVGVSNFAAKNPLFGDDFAGQAFEVISALGSKVIKEVFKKSTKIIDSGIQFFSQSLADIISTGAVEAFAYADVQTKKKILGITTSNKVKTETQDLNDVILGQFADVFEGAGDALGLAAEAFGLEFDDYINKLVVDPQKLSLKGLEGDALTKEIEAFFSSTLDNWAGVLTKGSDVLLIFQQVGEGAFETVIRLANQLNTFNSYADALNLNFEAVGFEAVVASQNIASFAGGFDQLGNSLGGYYQNFFTEEERAAKQMDLLAAELAELGVNAVPTSREAFRDMIESLADETGLMTVESQKQFAALLNLQGVFAELVPATEALVEASRSAKDIALERLGLEGQLLQLQGDTEELRRREREALDESNRSLYDQIKALEDLSAINNERLGLETQLLQLYGQTEELRRREREALDESNRSLYDQIKAQEDLNTATQIAAGVTSERLGLEGQFLQLQGETEELRRRERASLDETNRSLYDQIKALEDLNAITNERLGLEGQLLQLQGDTEELRRRELEALDPSNRALQELIWSLQDAAAAADAAARANEEMIASLRNSASAAMDMVSKSIDAERARIDGIVGRATDAKAALDDAIGREKGMLSQSHDAKIKALEDMARAEQEAAKEASRLQKQAAQDQLSAVSETIKNLSSLFDSLSDAAYGMAIESDELTRTRRRAAEFEIETALRNAKAGRGLPNADDIQGALSTLQDNPAALYSSFEEMAYATAVTQNRILELADMAGGQLSLEQQRLAALQAQVDAAEATVEMAGKYDTQILEERARYESQVAELDAQQELARKQLDKLTGIDTSVPTLAEAIAAYNESLLAADFDNAKEQLAALDEMEATAQAQLDALLGVESEVLSVHEALLRFGDAVKIANERISASGMESAVASTAKTNAELLEQVTASREESRELNNVIRQNTQDIADILRQMQEEALAL